MKTTCWKRMINHLPKRQKLNIYRPLLENLSTGVDRYCKPNSFYQNRRAKICLIVRDKQKSNSAGATNVERRYALSLHSDTFYVRQMANQIVNNNNKMFKEAKDNLCFYHN